MLCEVSAVNQQDYNTLCFVVKADDSQQTGSIFGRIESDSVQKLFLCLCGDLLLCLWVGVDGGVLLLTSCCVSACAGKAPRSTICCSKWKRWEANRRLTGEYRFHTDLLLHFPKQLKSLRTKKTHETAPCSSVIQVSTSPKIPHWFDKMLFTPLAACSSLCTYFTSVLLV